MRKWGSILAGVGLSLLGWQTMASAAALDNLSRKLEPLQIFAEKELCTFRPPEYAWWTVKDNTPPIHWENTSDGAWLQIVPQDDKEQWPGVVFHIPETHADWRSYQYLAITAKPLVAELPEFSLELRNARQQKGWLPVSTSFGGGTSAVTELFALTDAHLDQSSVRELHIFAYRPKQELSLLIQRVALRSADVGLLLEQWRQRLVQVEEMRLPEALRPEYRALAERLTAVYALAASQPESALRYGEECHNFFQQHALEVFRASHEAAAYTPEAPMADQTRVERHGQTWQLVWHDEFTGSGRPDSQNWSYEEGAVRNLERQVYSDALENAFLAQGTLSLRAIRRGEGTAQITSASMHTLGKRHFAPGRLEIRAMVPEGRGVWPALWLMGANTREVGDPACGEIDLMEHGGSEPDMIYHTVHIASADGQGVVSKHEVHPMADLPYRYIVFALEWDGREMAMYADNALVYTYSESEMQERYPGSHWPFGPDQELYLLMNLAIGGTWGGNMGVDDGIFPVVFQIDYVRYFQVVK